MPFKLVGTTLEQRTKQPLLCVRRTSGRQNFTDILKRRTSTNSNVHEQYLVVLLTPYPFGYGSDMVPIGNSRGIRTLVSWLRTRRTRPLFDGAINMKVSQVALLILH